MVTSHNDIVDLDLSVVLPRGVWVASDHVGVSNDPFTECLSYHKHFRIDQIQEELTVKKGIKDPDSIELAEITCGNCGTHGQWTKPRDFNIMLKTYLGSIEDESGLHYLRPETARDIFVDFQNVMTSTRKRPPFGIGQIGKSFRNEIMPRNFVFCTREFEQTKMEFFVRPGADGEWHQYWTDERRNWYVGLGIDPENLRLYEHPRGKLSHYPKRTVDIEYHFGFRGSDWSELKGVANHTDFDLLTHTKHSDKGLSYFSQANSERWIPCVIEPAAGLTRSLVAFLVETYTEDKAPNAKGGVNKRVVLRLDLRLSPIKVAMFPSSRDERLPPLTRKLVAELRKGWNIDFDDAGTVGRHYRRQDGIGTPFYITVNFGSLEDRVVTIRDRNTME